MRPEVRRILEAIEAFNRRDFEAAVAAFTEDAEWHPYLSALQSRMSRGRDEIETMARDLTDTFEGFRFEVVEIIDMGERVVGVVRASGRAGSRGPATEQRWAQLYTLRDGLIARVEPFATKEEAVAEAEGRGA